jgi:hypothetical protein
MSWVAGMNSQNDGVDFSPLFFASTVFPYFYDHDFLIVIDATIRTDQAAE